MDKEDEKKMPILTTEEAAELLRISYTEVRRLMGDGTLPYTCVGGRKKNIRINRADVLALVPPGGGAKANKGGSDA